MVTKCMEFDRETLLTIIGLMGSLSLLATIIIRP
jgi:hypothetical protein